MNGSNKKIVSESIAYSTILFTVKKYQNSDCTVWDAFVAQSRNGTFLFQRKFMEYHHDRFLDYSLLVYKNDDLIAVVPAHQINDSLYSHWGLTYGGLVLPLRIHISDVLGLFAAVLRYLKQHAITALHIKEIPGFYAMGYSGELAYLMQLCQAKITRVDLLSSLDLHLPLQLSKSRKESIRRGQKKGLIIREEADFTSFWNTLLIPNLEKRHQTQPVHTLEEITYLQRQFPKNIRHFNVYLEGQLVAGTTVFDTGRVAHPQYVAGDDQRSETGALDYLYDYLITEVYRDCRVFDFGISNENQGKNINAGLQFWKESYGTQPVAQHFYQVDTAHFSLLDSVLV